MSKTGEICEKTMEELLEGKRPLDVCERIDKLAHRAVWDACVEDRVSRRIGEDAQLDGMAIRMEKYKERMAKK